jgi:hypothetical protein
MGLDIDDGTNRIGLSQILVQQTKTSVPSEGSALDMKVVCWLLTGFIGLSLTTAAGAWEVGDRSNYNNKMALIGVLLEGAKERAQVRGEIETLCLLLSIGKDVTTSYVNVAPNNQQINQRLVEMNKDLNRFLSMLQKTAFKP